MTKQELIETIRGLLDEHGITPADLANGKAGAARMPERVMPRPVQEDLTAVVIEIVADRFYDDDDEHHPLHWSDGELQAALSDYTERPRAYWQSAEGKLYYDVSMLALLKVRNYVTLEDGIIKFQPALMADYSRLVAQMYGPRQHPALVLPRAAVALRLTAELLAFRSRLKTVERRVEQRTPQAGLVAFVERAREMERGYE